MFSGGTPNDIEAIEAKIGNPLEILDPGIALNYRGNYEAYTRMQLEVIASSSELHQLGRPVLIPIPRCACE